MDRLVICIEDEKVELSIYHHDNYNEFDINIMTYEKMLDLEISDNNARDMANAILKYLDNKK